MTTHHHKTPTVDKAWEFIQSETRAGRPFPDTKDIARHIGRKEGRLWCGDVMHGLLMRGLCCCARIGKTKNGRTSHDWTLTRYGRYAIEFPEADDDRASICAGEPAAAASSSEKRKPRRTGEPKRVPHKPTTPHRKPTRKQRRETERRREQEGRATV